MGIGKMTHEEWEALGVQTFGLPQDLFVPIAASGLEEIESYVGNIQECLHGRKRPINAAVVVAQQPDRNPKVPLWDLCEAEQYYLRLHPSRQLWVHVDYTGYRGAWKMLGFGELPSEIFLDHIRNRVVVRLTEYRHPFLRVIPVSRATNTSGGLNRGFEGMEKVEMRKMAEEPVQVQQRVERCFSAPVVLADPFDLTKMLDIPPGLFEMQGVASMLKKFYLTTG